MDYASVINSYIGTPWLKCGETAKGVDCWGFLRLFFRQECGLALPGDYHAHLNPEGVSFNMGDKKRILDSFNTAAKSVTWTRIESPIDYSVVAMSSGRNIHHVGVWLGNGCIHAVQGVGVVYNTLNQLKRNSYNHLEFYTCKNLL